MKKKLSYWVCFMLLFAFIEVEYSSADIAPSEPNCPQEWSSNPYGQNDICKVINKKVTIEKSDAFSAGYEYVMHEGDGAYCKNNTYYTLPDNLNISYNSHASYTLMAVKKSFLDQSGGINGIFKTNIIKDTGGECETDTIMNPKNQKDFDENFYNLTIAFENKDDLAWWRQETARNEVSDRMFPSDVYPYLVVPANSPVMSKEFVYRPFMRDCESYSKKPCDIVLYKSKEIWTLDNGDKKEYSFIPPTGYSLDQEGREFFVDDNLRQATLKKQNLDQMRVTQDVTNQKNQEINQVCAPLLEKQQKELQNESLWQKVICIFKNLFGKKC